MKDLNEIIDEKTKQKVFQQTLDIWVKPEIEKRKKNNKIKDKLFINKIQIVFSLDKLKNEIRLNEEVKAVINAKPNKPIKKGEIVYECDLDAIKGRYNEKDISSL